LRDAPLAVYSAAKPAPPVAPINMRLARLAIVSLAPKALLPLGALRDTPLPHAPLDFTY
jgi:hypothetical protein